MVDESKFNSAMEFLKHYWEIFVGFFGLILTLLGYQQKQISDIRKKYDSEVKDLYKEIEQKEQNSAKIYLSKEVFDEFKESINSKLDDIKDDIREIKDLIKNWQ